MVPRVFWRHFLLFDRERDVMKPTVALSPHDKGILAGTRKSNPAEGYDLISVTVLSRWDLGSLHLVGGHPEGFACVRLDKIDTDVERLLRVSVIKPYSERKNE